MSSPGACLTPSPSFLTYSACDYAVVATVAPLFSSIYTSSVLAYSLTASSAFDSYDSSAYSYYYVPSYFWALESAYCSLISVFPSACSVWVAWLSSSVSESFDLDFIWANKWTWVLILAWSLTYTFSALLGDVSSPLAKNRSILTMFFKKPHSA